MGKRIPLDKTQARERRNQLLESAATTGLTLTEGVREMRAISGMTQDEFAQHRGVSAGAIKAIELRQGNPTVATLNRIGQFFGLEVAFVPMKRSIGTVKTYSPDSNSAETTSASLNAIGAGNPEIQPEKYLELSKFMGWEAMRQAVEARESIVATMRQMSESLSSLDKQLDMVDQVRKTVEAIEAKIGPQVQGNQIQEPGRDTSSADKALDRKKK